MKSVLLFLAGVLVGANLVYFALHRTRAPTPPSCPPTGLAHPRTPPPRMTITPGGRPSATTSATPTMAMGRPAPAATPAPESAPARVPSPSMPALTPGALLLPVAGVTPGQLTDTFNDTRDGVRRHEALDIMATRGTPVLAAADGTVAKLFTSVPGGLTIYEFDPSRTYAYYYAHLDRYAPGLANGKALTRGEVIGYVGSTGNASADAPHLHFAIFLLGPEKQWWKGTAIDPYPLLTGRQASRP